MIAPARVASASTLAGCPVAAGTPLLLPFPAANRDPALFDRADEVLLDRSPNRQIAFGYVPHVCLGQSLARLELTCFFRELLARVEHIELAGEPRWTESSFVGGVKSLPVRYRMR